MDNEFNLQTNQLIEAVAFYQSLVLDCVQQELGDHPSWPGVRSRILRAFGDRGLTNRVREIMSGRGGAQ